MTKENPTAEELDSILQYQYGSYGVELPQWYADDPGCLKDSALNGSEKTMIAEETKSGSEQVDFILPEEAVKAVALAIRKADDAMFDGDGDDDFEPKLTDFGATVLANVALKAAVPIMFARIQEQQAQLDAVLKQVEVWESQKKAEGEDLAAHVSEGAFRIAAKRIRTALKLSQ